MEPVVVDAADRFSSIKLSTRVEDGEGASLDTLYSCPSCEQGVRFSRSSLEQARSTTCLEAPDADTVDRVADVHGLAPLAFVDWYCAGCRMPRRAYFSRLMGGQQGDHGVLLSCVVEVVADDEFFGR